MWYGRRVAVIFPAYNEEDNVAHAIEDFLAAGGGGIVDEVIAVDNNSRDKTADRIKSTSATYVLETKQGYGNALQRGLAEAASRGAELIVMAEPDGTFAGKDVLKLLAFSDDFDLVLGTRTTKELIWQEANMGRFLRWGNWAVAKFLQVLHDGPSLSDCGCTLRLVHTDAYRVFASHLTVGRSHFLPEMVCLSLAAGLRMVEVPVNYRGRVGESKITGTLSTTLRVGTRMIALILGYWVKRRFGIGLIAPLPIAPVRARGTLR